MSVMTTQSIDEVQLFEIALKPVERWSRGAQLLAAVLILIISAGVYAYVQQARTGLAVTGLNFPVFWGVYITNLIFFIGISYAGTLISAVLRLFGAEWRKPLTRMAEAITVFALMVAPFNVVFDLGRPDRWYAILIHPHFTSPLVWDVCAIGVYFTFSIIYFTLPLIPDIAILRDRYPNRKVYRWLALGWKGSPGQISVLHKVIGFLAIAIIPVAITGHTVLGWVFSMTVQPMWHSTIFGPYFVLGAIFSGTATLFLVLAAVRGAYGLQKYIHPRHFELLGYLLIALTAMWGYFTFAEMLTTFYSGQPEELRVFFAKVSGEYAWAFWLMVFSMLGAFFTLTLPFIPTHVQSSARMLFGKFFALATLTGMVAFSLNGSRYLHPALSAHPGYPLEAYTKWSANALEYYALALLCMVMFIANARGYLKSLPVSRMVAASILVNIGMWLERYIIVVPSLSHPRIPLGTTVYHPSWVEWTLTAACFALLALFILVFSRYFPMLPLWEMTEKTETATGNEQTHAGANPATA